MKWNHLILWLGMVFSLLATPVSAADTASKIAFDYFVGAGYTEIAAAAICGNLHHESGGMSSTRLQDQEGQPSGRHAPETPIDDVTGYGIAQWTSIDRQQALQDFADEHGMRSGDLLLQLMFVDKELRDYGQFDVVNSMTDLETATLYICNNYERPNELYAAKPIRIAFAQEYFAKKGVGISGALEMIDGVLTWAYGTLNIDFSELLNIGESIGDGIELIVGACTKAIGFLDKHAMWLLLTFATLDLAVYLSFTVGLAGAGEIFRTLAIRFIKYGFFAFLISHWGDIVNMFFIGLFDNGGAIAAGRPDIATMITNPEVLLRANLAHANPSFNYLSSTRIIDLITWYPLTLLHICVILWIFLFSLALTFYVMVSYLEFMIAAALAVITIPFGVSKHMKFIPEGLIGSVFSSSLKLLCLGFMLGMLGNSLQEMSYTATGWTVIWEIFKFMICFIISIGLIVFIPSKFAKELGGKVELQ